MQPNNALAHRYMDSPVGKLKLVADEQHLVAILWEHDRPKRVPLEHSREDELHPILKQAERQLTEYFALKRHVFDVPLRFNGTPFQQQVWKALLKINNGETWSYQQLARHIRRPTAARAVGAAVGRNPISIIVPCHRVIGAGGKLTGFAGGLAAKSALLRMEQSK